MLHNGAGDCELGFVAVCSPSMLPAGPQPVHQTLACGGKGFEVSGLFCNRTGFIFLTLCINALLPPYPKPMGPFPPRGPTTVSSHRQPVPPPQPSSHREICLEALSDLEHGV